MTSISEKNLVAIRRKIDSQANARLVGEIIHNHPWIDSNKLRRADIYDEWSLLSDEIFLRLSRSLNIIWRQVKDQYQSLETDER